MSYEPTVWQTGDTVTAEKLNKLENGLSEVSKTGNFIVKFNALGFTSSQRIFAFIVPMGVNLTEKTYGSRALDDNFIASNYISWTGSIENLYVKPSNNSLYYYPEGDNTYLMPVLYLSYHEDHSSDTEVSVTGDVIKLNDYHYAITGDFELTYTALE